MEFVQPLACKVYMASKDSSSIWGWIVVGGILLAFANAGKKDDAPQVRKPFTQSADDPSTTNDESNDQPVGHFGTLTLQVTSDESGNTYTLDAEMEGLEVSRIFFPRGGEVDFFDCELEEDFTGVCIDEEGRGWTFEGE